MIPTSADTANDSAKCKAGALFVDKWFVFVLN
jgi:hypothetical protein